ncbi:uncharacterized protein A1O9_12563 [Exophiala aquamarina CBS 119918]|uniref:DCG1-like protein n=1 Tax=Exophiala aquamarina CBS 119918 TaxID=1182545 RepID=A0A072NU74_9EURO|nr:uncharacterized protein A1O9_12563 [Exophiala aquamarina CBS 119918]KEF51414.1 hypothetical protein A1O9_12563 [Exophiala aquamarina CBS 119918]
MATATSSPPSPPSLPRQRLRMLIINPNTSTSMTESLAPLLDSLAYPSDSIQYTFFTSPNGTTATSTTGTPEAVNLEGIPSINSPADAAASAKVCLPHLTPLIPHHDAFLIACYSQHPLVSQLKAACAGTTRAATKGSSGSGARKYVTGIFEASVLACLALLDNGDGGGNGNETFGIVSTGKIWETVLQDAVAAFLGAEASRRFAGVETTGLNATDLHDLPADQVRDKMMQATKRLLRRGTTAATSGSDPGTGGSGDSGRPRRSSPVKAVCLGCAGMAGLDDAVRQACVEELGQELGKQVHIVDGVKAGVGILVGLASAGFG